jgi:hypothetical protein
MPHHLPEKFNCHGTIFLFTAQPTHFFLPSFVEDIFKELQNKCNLMNALQ